MIRSVVGVAAAMLVVPAAALGAPSVTGEFAMPGTSEIGSDNEIVMAPDGNMWVTTDADNGVARFTPDGVGTFFPLAATAYGITVGPDGNLWASQSIGVAKIDPATGTAVETPIGGVYAQGRGITTGPDGKIWIIGSNSLARIDPANPAVGQDVNPIVTANPKGMTTGSDGLLWFADGDKIFSATATDTPVLTPYAVGGGTQDVAAGPNAQVAYANPQSSPHSVGRISPGGTPQVTDLETSDPFGVVFGQDQAYWVARSSTDDLLRLAPDGTTTTLTGFSVSGNVGPRKIATGPGNTLWVTLDTQNKVARVSGVDPPVTPPPPGGAPETTIDKGPKKKIKTSKKKAKVKFKFSSTSAGATFECAATRKGKQPKPKPCESPKSYKLKPGRYKFQVAATAVGLTDASPAVQKFKVVATG